MAGTPGIRVFNGRYYALAGRGTKARCQQEATSLRQSWRYVRVVPWNPFLRSALRAALDDYAIFVFKQRQEVARCSPPMRAS